jgi:hypothetical protein
MSLTHFLLRRGLIDRLVKPARDHAVVRRWMATGRPSPPPHAVKVAAVLMLADLHQLDLFIETGTHYGRMVRALAPRFRTIYSIELSPRLAAIATKEFGRYRHIKIVEGDSAECLPQLIIQLKQPALFWLDAHFCSGESAQGEEESPIESEIAAIISRAPKGSVILVDDARCFCGNGGYPTLGNFTDSLRRRTGKSVVVFDDMIYAVL